MRSALCVDRVMALAVVVGAMVLGALAGCTAVTAPGEEILRPTAAAVAGRFHEGIPYSARRALDIHTPSREAQLRPATVPVIVLLHGCCGDRSDLGKLSEALTAAQLVVFNADWAGLDADATFPAAYEDVACAIGFARQHAREFGGDPERVIVAGWSDGAMAAAAVAAAPETFEGHGCLAARVAGAAPTAVVGIGGFYGWTLPVPATYVTPRTSRLFGGSPETASENWATATPYSWLTSAPSTLLLVGTTDPLIDDARRYSGALRQTGRPVRVVAIPPDGDQSLISPRTSEGRRVVAEISALAGATPTHLTSPHSR